MQWKYGHDCDMILVEEVRRLQISQKFVYLI